MFFGRSRAKLSLQNLQRFAQLQVCNGVGLLLGEHKFLVCCNDKIGCNAFAEIHRAAGKQPAGGYKIGRASCRERV